MKQALTEEHLLELGIEELDLPHVLRAVERYCLTTHAREIVRALRPKTNIEEITSELSRVQEALNLIAGGVSIPFGRLNDIRELLAKSRIAGNYLSAPDLLIVQEAMATSRQLKRFFDEQAESAPYLNDLCEPLVSDKIVEKHITDAIDDTGDVRDTASKELRSIRSEIFSLSAKLRNRIFAILKKFGEEELLQDEFVTQRDGRFVVPLRVENKRAVDGIIHGVSATGSTVFLEPAETYEMNNELSILKSREHREILRILTSLTAEVGSISTQIGGAYDVMTMLDTIMARARYALDFGGIEPVVVNEPIIELRKVRHPVLQEQANTAYRETKQRPEVIPLDVTLDDKVRGLLISGPNAGGKTVAMKTIGVSLAMAMSGIFPLGECRCGVYRLFAAIGDHQSIDSNLSTFSSQILRLRDVLGYCDSSALVLIDEICAGTDPYEGGALAAGVLDSLLERGASFVVTTHQSSLKQYALTRSSITNASLAFDEEKLQPTFTFLFGVPGNSYAFDLARNVGLPSIVVERAHGYLGDRHDELEESINAIQQFRREAEEIKRVAAVEQQQAKSLREDLEQRLLDVKQRKSKEIDAARAQARMILEQANAAVENAIREGREAAKPPKEIKSELEEHKQKLNNQLRGFEGDTTNEPVALSVGDIVKISGTATEGVVISIDNKNANATIDVNGMKFSVPQQQLELCAPASSTAASSHRARTLSAKPPSFQPTTSRPMPQMSLDIRGKRADEAQQLLEAFLDDAIVNNMPFASIIHGKGTGVLRTVVLEYLESRTGISAYRLGEIHEGGDGVTIVEF